MATTPGTLPQVTPELLLINLVPCATDYIFFSVLKIKKINQLTFSFHLFFAPQRFKQLCSPAKTSSLPSRHFPNNNSALPYGPAMPLTEKPK